MRHWNLRRRLLGGTASLMCVFAWALLGCGDDNDEAVISGGLVDLAAADGPSLSGLIFDFTDATIFGFPGESATLEVGDGAATFILTTSGGTVIRGTITTGASAAPACRLAQNLSEVGAGTEPFDEQYDMCQASIDAQEDITFGASGPGTATLGFGRTGEIAVASGPEEVTLHLHDDGTVTINNNATPI
jgi:hypothetical protein